jgi:hypothetical protein
MTMQYAIDQYLAAATETELASAYDALLQNYASDGDLLDDADFDAGVDKMLNDMGLPALIERLHRIKMQEIEAGNAVLPRYQIENVRSGVVLGVYKASSEADALDAMARDAGYADYEEACEVAPTFENEISVKII